MCLTAKSNVSKKKHQSIIYVTLCNVSCNFRCKVLVLSRYCTVDGTFLCLLYVSNVQKKAYCQFIYCFWSMCILIVNVLIIRMPFSESQWCLGKNAIVLYKKKSVVYIMYIFLLVFVTIICFSMVLKSMKKPENLFVCLEYDINRNVKIDSQPCWGGVGVQWHAVGLKWLQFSPRCLLLE